MTFGIPLSRISLSSSSGGDIQNVQVVGGVEANVIITGSTIELKSLVTASQGGLWFITSSGDVGYLRQSPSRDLFVTGTMTTVQGTTPWTVAGTDFDIRDLTYISDSVTVYGDNGVALQQDGNDKLIVVDSALSSALNDTKTTLSGAISQSTNTLSGAIANSGTSLSSSIASFANANHTDLLAISGALNAVRLEVSGVHVTLDTTISGAINDSRNSLSGAIASFANINHSDLLIVSSSINDTKTTLSTSLANFQSQNNTNLLNVSSSIVASQNVLSNSLAAIFNELNSGDVDIRNLSASNDNVEVFGRNLFSQTKYPLLTDAVGHLSVSQGPSGSLPWKVTLTDNSGSLVGTVAAPLAVKATEAIPVVTSEAQWPTYSTVVTGTLLDSNGKSLYSLVYNQTGSNILKIQKIHIINNTQAAATNGVFSSFELYRITSSSAGINIPIVKYDTTDPDPTNIVAKNGATITGEDANLFQRWTFSTDEWQPASSKVEAFDHLHNQLFPAYQYDQSMRIKPITLRTGQGINLKWVGVQSGPASVFDIFVVFTVEPDVIA